MVPDPTRLIAVSGIRYPIVGLYDTDEPERFGTVTSLPEDRHVCVFAHFKQWCEGGYSRISADHFGCAGAGYWMCGVRSRPREAMVEFLADEEGLKASHALMNQWLDVTVPYEPEKGDVVIGPLRDDLFDELKTVTFFVNPDQLGLMMLAANYHAAPEDLTPVIAPFGSGCSQLVTLFHDLESPQAVIGATDIAMRAFLPPDVMNFTVTRPMFERMCALDDDSFLARDFWKRLRRARRAQGGNTE